MKELVLISIVELIIGFFMMSNASTEGFALVFIVCAAATYFMDIKSDPILKKRLVNG